MHAHEGFWLIIFQRVNTSMNTQIVLTLILYIMELKLFIESKKLIWKIQDSKVNTNQLFVFWCLKTFYYQKSSGDGSACLCEQSLSKRGIIFKISTLSSFVLSNLNVRKQLVIAVKPANYVCILKLLKNWKRRFVI